MAEEWERIIDLGRYYPEFLKNIRELRIINDTDGEEIRRLYEKSDQLWEDGFINEATLQGIKRWESLLGIKPYPGDTLKERRSAVLGRWNQQLPYTLARLRERLMAVVGEDGYELEVRNRLYELEINIPDQPYRVLQSLHDMTKQMIPANLDLIFAGKYSVDMPADIGLMADLRMDSEFFARYNREYLRLDSTWQLNNTYRLNNYKEKESMEFYPGVITVRGGFGTEVRTAEAVGAAGTAEAGPETEHCLTLEGAAEKRTETESAWKLQTGLLCGVRENFGMTMEHNKWLLDDSCRLDNSKKLDAYYVRYDL